MSAFEEFSWTFLNSDKRKLSFQQEFQFEWLIDVFVMQRILTYAAKTTMQISKINLKHSITATTGICTRTQKYINTNGKVNCIYSSKGLGESRIAMQSWSATWWEFDCNLEALLVRGARLFIDRNEFRNCGQFTDVRYLLSVQTFKKKARPF